MSAKDTAAASLIMLMITSCASTSEEERARGAQVRVSNDPAAVRQCRAIGTVTDDEIPALQKKAARLGGDVALVTMHSQRSDGVYGGGTRKYTTVV